MVQQNEMVNYQGRRAKVTSVQGEPPNQILNIRFDDNSERIVTLAEIAQSDKPTQLPSSPNKPTQPIYNPKPVRPNQDLPDYGKPKATPYGNQRADVTEPPLEGGEPTPPFGIEEGGDATPNDLGPGTGDSGAGLKADGKDVDSPRRRLLGTEEIVVYIEPVTRKVVDRNGRKLEVGTTISIKARIIGMKENGMVEVLYPPYTRTSPFPVWSADRERLEYANEDNEPNGNEYSDGIYSYRDGKVQDANGNPPPEFEAMKQTKLQVPVKFVERF
jgi:hypothetical protein